MGIHELAPNLGLVLAPLIMAWCLSHSSWRTAFFAMAAGVLIIGICFLFYGRGGGVHDELPSWSTLKKIVKNRSILTISVLLTLGVGAEVGIYSVLTLFLVSERGYDPAAANNLLGLARLPGMLMVLISGWLCDRLGLKWALISVLTVTGGVLIALGVCPVQLTPALVVAQAAASACIFPPILAAATVLSEPGTRVWTLGISLGICAIAGGGAMPAAVAIAGEWGSFGLGISSVGILVLCGAFLVPSLKLDQSC
jgi:predicted MFS family arabinose efflux permease